MQRQLFQLFEIDPISANAGTALEADTREFTMPSVNYDNVEPNAFALAI